MAQNIYTKIAELAEGVARFEGQIVLVTKEETETTLYPATSDTEALGKRGDSFVSKDITGGKLVSAGSGLWVEVQFSARPILKVALDLAPAPKERKGKGEEVAEVAETPEAA